MLHTFAAPINLGLADVAPALQCLGMPGFGAKLRFWLVLPAVLLLLLFLAQLWRHRQLDAALYASITGALRLLFLFYPTVTTTCFEAFPLYDFDADGQFLTADVAIRIGSNVHRGIVRTAWLGIVACPLGLLGLQAALLLRARRAIVGGKPTKLSAAIAFLYADYTPSCYLWELAEVVRRLVLVGFFVVALPGSLTQLALGLMVSQVHLLLQLKVSLRRVGGAPSRHASLVMGGCELVSRLGAVWLASRCVLLTGAAVQARER